MKYTINGIEYEVSPDNVFSTNVSIPGGPIQPVEPMVPMSRYNEMTKLWIDARNENEQLRKELAALKARQIDE